MRLGYQFPADYRTFLAEASDVVVGALEPSIVIPDAGYLDLVETARIGWEPGVSEEWLPFCEDNGNYFCLVGTQVRVLVARRNDPGVMARSCDVDQGGLGRRARVIHTRSLNGLSPSFLLVDEGPRRVSIRPVAVRRPIDRIEMDMASLARHEEGLP